MADDIFLSRGKDGVGYRLTLTRDALGYDQGAFAARAGLKANTYNQYETGKNLPNMDAAQALCDSYKLRLDWIFRGDTSDLRHETADAITALRKSRALRKS